MLITFCNAKVAIVVVVFIEYYGRKGARFWNEAVITMFISIHEATS